MRLALLADVHGNLPALEAVLADVRTQDVDGIAVAGDHLTGGPCPAETHRLLSSLDAWAIRGNTDDRVLAYDASETPVAWRTSEQWAALRWLHDRLEGEAIAWIASLPEQRAVAIRDAPPVRVVHGTPHSPTQHTMPDRDPACLRLFERAGLLPIGRDPPSLADVLARIDEPVLVCGHSHIPWAQAEGDRLALNPGSVGAPVNGDVRAQYALLTWEGRWSVQHRAVPYDLERTRRAYRESGLLAEAGPMGRAFLLSVETGRSVVGFYVAHVQALAAQAGAGGRSVVPEEVWERAVATFDWATYEGQRIKSMPA